MTLNEATPDDDFWNELQSRFPAEGEFETVLERVVKPAMSRAYTQSRVDAAQRITEHVSALGAPTGEYERGYATGMTHASGIIS